MATMDAAALLGRLAGLPTAAPILTDLPRLLGETAEALETPLAALLEADLATVWTAAPGGPTLILSAAGAARAGIELDATAEDPAGWRWRARGAPAPPSDRRRTGARINSVVGITETDIGTAADPFSLDELAGPAEASDTLEAEDRAESVEKLRGHYARTLMPFPRRFLGLDRPWPIRAAEKFEPPAEPHCPVCGGRRLALTTACLWCNRTGADHLIPRPAPAELRRAYRPDPGLKGGKSSKGG